MPKPEMVDGRKTIWTCAACGKVGEDRDTLGDVSCFTNAVLVYEDSIKWATVHNGERARVISADAVENIESRRCTRCGKWITVTSSHGKDYCPECSTPGEGVKSG